MNAYCDNYSRCNSVMLDWSPEPIPQDRLRAAGWHVYRGDNFTGQKLLEVALCPKCVGNGPREKPPVVLEGQEELF